MNFLKIIGNSIHSPQFYSSVPKKTLKQSLGYFFLLILLLTIINLVTLANTLLVEAPKAIADVTQSLINCLPVDLEVKIKDGQVSTNKQEPYFIPPCREGWDNSSVVIDTKTPYSPAKFEEYNKGAQDGTQKAATWITKDEIVYKRSDVESRTYSLKEIQDFTLNKSVVESFYNMYLPYLKFVGPILLLLAFLGTYLFYSFRLTHLLIIALLVWVLSKAFKQTLSFGSSYKVGLHAITLGLIVELVISLTHRWTHFTGFPFMVTILTLAVVWVNLFQNTESKKKS